MLVCGCDADSSADADDDAFISGGDTGICEYDADEVKDDATLGNASCGIKTGSGKIV